MMTPLPRLLLALGSALLALSHASPLHDPAHQPERILFASEPDRDVRNTHEQRRHGTVAAEGALVVRAIEGQNVVLECEAASRNGPAIHWLHRGHRIAKADDGSRDEDDVELFDGQGLSTGSTKSRLYLDCVDLQDAGEYVCVADTPTSRNISIRTLVIDSLPSVLKERRTSRGHAARRAGKGRISSSCVKGSSDKENVARIYEWSTRRLVVEDNDIRLTCRASGLPQPKITWLDRDEKPISREDKQYQLLDNGDLVIRKTTFKKNMGVYQCVADNGFSSDTVSTFVYPAGKDIGPPSKYVAIDLSD